MYKPDVALPLFLKANSHIQKKFQKHIWTDNSLGNPEAWPPSLQTALGIVFSSPFPMCLFWGDDSICFYNDAFATCIDNGTLQANAAKASDVWPDAWKDILPIIDRVKSTAEAASYNDVTMPFLQNKELNKYWTYSYSPVFGDSGGVDGVLVTCIETTHHVQAKRSAEASEQRMLSFIESAPFPIGIYIGEEMRISIANKSIIEIWGKGPDVVGKKYAEVLPELESQKVYEQLADVYNRGIPFHAHNQRIDLVVNGKLGIFYFNYSFTPLFDTDGKVYGVMNTAADVTDLYMAKQAIEQNERTIRNMVLQAPVAMCIMLGPQHVVSIANSMMIDLWGKPAGTVLNKPIFEALPDARDQGLELLLDGVYQTGKAFAANERPVVLLRNGKEETVYQNFVYEPYRDNEGNVAGIIAISLDVTAQVVARKHVEKVISERTAELQRSNTELRISEERYHRMVDEVEDYAIILLDKNGVVQNWNRGAEKIKGYSEQEIVGKSFHTFYQKEDLENGVPQKLIREAFINGKATTEGWRLTKGGGRFWGSVLITALHDDDGNVIGFSKVTRDLTEKKMADDKLREYSQSLEFQNKELEQFAYAASHDMKEPLRKIHFFASYLTDNLSEKLDTRSAEYLNRILAAARKMTSLVENILTYSKTTANIEDTEPVDFNELVNEIRNGLKEEHEDGSVLIEADNLPIINGIPFQFEQLLDNLIHNAIKYKHPDRHSHIKIAYALVTGKDVPAKILYPAAQYHKISVIDNGIGFEPEYAEKVFEIFQRLHSPAAKSGAGIGLAICKRVVQNHKGYIAATAKPNQGARFDIYLPK